MYNLIRRIKSGILYRVCLYSLYWKLNSIIIQTVDFFIKLHGRLQTFISLYPLVCGSKLFFLSSIMLVVWWGRVSWTYYYTFKNLNQLHLEVKTSPGSPTVAKDRNLFWQMVGPIMFLHIEGMFIIKRVFFFHDLTDHT